MTHMRRGGERKEKGMKGKVWTALILKNTWMEGTSEDRHKDFYLLKKPTLCIMVAELTEEANY